MRLQGRSLSFVVSFLLGVAWATAFLGFILTFLANYHSSIFFALFSSVMATLPGLIGVLLIEHFISSKEKEYQLQRQTKLLEEILDKVSSS